ncbi:hypothetical protein [Bacillus sp. TE8-1]|uniref:hypothetical protein n=1 Tax=Bacillus sp. TE8-1 TaxID=2217829 RepID=UPI0011EC3FD7|nr:hypothetical protein [Bacillus sp. TE8-1]KAA0761716.1 hypothetical protein DN404_25175 [Bacillus sp. TE8-1]
MKCEIEYEDLKKDYNGFQPYFEVNRGSVEKLFLHYLTQGNSNDFNTFLKQNTDMAVSNEFKQKFIYNSTLCFYRAFDLFLALLTLKSRKFSTWSEVTAYYSKFYIIKAICFTFQRGYMVLNTSKNEPLKNKNDKKFFFTFDSGIQVYNQKTIEYKLLFENNLGSHQVWWTLLETLKGVKGLRNQRFQFLLDQSLSNPAIRNEVNYSLEYLEGFNELEWFDTNIKERFNRNSTLFYHKDFTSKDRYFYNIHPEDIDEGEYYTDLRVFIWESLLCYLEITKDLLGENFLLKMDNIVALLDEHHIKDIDSSLENNMKMALQQILKS